jgi:hypothetical protein
MFPHAFKMKIHGFTNQLFYLVQRCPGDTQPGKSGT